MKFMEGIIGEGGTSRLAMMSLVGYLSKDKKVAIANGFKSWLAEDARKAVRDDLPVLIAEFGKRIDRMVEDLDIEIVDDNPVVIAAGAGRDTLRALERGTNWFDPCDDVVSVLISSLWKS